MSRPTFFLNRMMSKNTGKIVEGVFAINKPPSISSAQVIRNFQSYFNPSKLFAPWIAAERAHRDTESPRERRRRKDKSVQVKIGHGGTLDPMATGVLIMGIGKGTKQLQGFLECTKSYEATILFGAATDTYDALGKVLRRAEYKHVTKEGVEKVLARFRGNIMQRPPIYSALRMQGKRLYEYAREGKEVPREIQERPVKVEELEVIEWLDGGMHASRLPKEEAEVEAKELAEKVLKLDGAVNISEKAVEKDVNGVKRKRELDDVDDISISHKRRARDDEEVDPQTLMSGALQSPDEKPPDPAESVDSATADADNHESPQQTSFPPDKGPPAVKLRMTVTSGFYVRSLSHDLGEAVGSLACMSELVRTRQGDFELGKNVMEYEELDKGEDVWGPQVEKLLEEWEERKTESDGNRSRTEDGREK